MWCVMIQIDISFHTTKTPITMNIVNENHKVLTFLEEAAAVGKTKDGKRELISWEFEKVELNLRAAVDAGLISLVCYEDGVVALCRLFSCLNERRSKQFAIAFSNAVRDFPKKRQQFLAKELKERVMKYPHLVTHGVQEWMDYMIERAHTKAA